MLMTRLLQFWFTPARSHFINIIRHPIGTMGDFLRDPPSNASIAHVFNAVKHWIRCNELMLDDMKHLQHAVLIRYETFATDNQAGLKFADDLSID